MLTREEFEKQLREALQKAGMAVKFYRRLFGTDDAYASLSPRAKEGYSSADALSCLALNLLEQQVHSVYDDAAQDMGRTVRSYFKKFAARDNAERARVASGEITQAEYTRWRLLQLARGDRYRAMRDKLADRATRANEVAAAYINDTTPSVYALNRNRTAYVIGDVGDGVDWALFDESTVRRLVKQQPNSMPHYPEDRAIDRGIDLAYGQRQITNQITSSILTGDSIGTIADKLQQKIVTMNRVSALRAARTAMTGAQNAGRLDSLLAAVEMGIKVKKGWVSTLDFRTRASHQHLDGELRELLELFSNGLLFPGDANGAPKEVYNCRCCLIGVRDGAEDTKRETYEQWAKRQKRPQKKTKRKAQKGDNAFDIPSKSESGDF